METVKSPFNPGDVVQYTDAIAKVVGRWPMSVKSVRMEPPIVVTCQWFNNDTLHENLFRATELELVPL